MTLTRLNVPKIITTRMLFCRIHTAHLLTVSIVSLNGGGGGVCLTWRGSAWRGIVGRQPPQKADLDEGLPYLAGVYMEGGIVGSQTPSPCDQTNTCENITFPLLGMRALKIMANSQYFDLLIIQFAQNAIGEMELSK